MARVTIVIGDGAAVVDSGGTQSIAWSGISAAIPDPPSTGLFADPAPAAARVTDLRVVAQGPANVFDLDTARRDLTPKWEAYDKAFQIGVAGRSFAFEGPAHANTFPDDSEPYRWFPGDAGDVVGLIAAWQAASAAERAAATLTLADRDLAAPVFADPVGDAIAGVQGVDIDVVAVPAASGEPAPTYAVHGALPAGLAFDPATREISGAAALHGSGAVVIRATNSEGHADWTAPYDFAPRIVFRIPRPALHFLADPPAPSAAGARWRRAARALAGGRGSLAACEIRHPASPVALRLASAGREVSLGGRDYLGVPFRWRLAPDEPDREPRTQIAIPWAGPEMGRLLEASGGGVGAEVRLEEWSFDPAAPDAPHQLEWRVVFHVAAASVDEVEDAEPVAGETPRALILDLGVSPDAGRPAVTARYTPESDPWAFA